MFPVLASASGAYCRTMKLDTLRKVALGAGILVLLGPVTVLNASAATASHGRRLPEKPATKTVQHPDKVNVDDLLQIKVDGPTELSGSYRVDPSGGIAYPYLGRVTVVGLKPAEVAKVIADGLKQSQPRELRVTVETERSSQR